MKIIIFFINILLFIPNIYAQNIDSLLEIRDYTNNQIDKYQIDIQLANGYLNKRDYENASIFIDEAIKLAENFENEGFKYRAYNLAGLITSDNQQYSKADSLFSAALPYTTDVTQKAELYSNKFETQYRLGNLEKGMEYLVEMRKHIGKDTTGSLMADYYSAYSSYYVEKRDFLNQLKYLLKSKELSEKRGENLSFINHNIANVYYGLGAFERFIEISLEQLKQNQVEEKIIPELFSLFSVADGYFALKDYTKCKEYCFQAIELKEKEGVSNVFGFVYYLLGRSHLEENQLDSAEYYFNKGIDISLERGENKELGDNYIGMSQLKLEQEKISEAKMYAEKARAVINYTDFATNNMLAKLYEEEGEYRKANELLRINSDKWEEEEENRTNYKIISSLLSEKYKQEKQEEKLAFQEAINRQRRFTLWSILLTVLLLSIVVVVIQARNNRKLRHLNTSLHQSNEALKQFTYITSHDLKEPIRNINSFAGLLKRRITKRTDNETDLEYLGFIQSSSSIMQVIVESLRVYVDTSVKKTIKEDVNIEETIETVKTNLNKLITERNGILEFENLEQIQTIRFSSPMLVLILQNLIQNGMKYNDSPIPKVKISISRKQNKILFKLSDNGVGIKTEFLEKIFQPFKTLENKSVIKSSGLGLTICKNIIEKYDGKIWAESDNQTGSQFYFCLDS